MKTHRIITHICILSAVVAAVLAGSAQASSLLSGYGGPGQGNQAVLGSALIKGPKGGGGSSGASSGAGSGSSSSAGVESSTTPSASDTVSGSGSSSQSSGGSSAAGSRSGKSSRSGGLSRRSARTGSGQRTSRATASVQSFYPAAERVPAGQQGGVLGLSVTDLVYIILAAAALALLAMLTRRFGQASSREGASG